MSAGRRWPALLALALAVAALHLWVADDVLESRIGSGDADTRPRRIEVAFVRQLMPAAPPVLAPAAPKPKRPRAAAAAAPAASAPVTAPSVPVPASAPPGPSIAAAEAPEPVASVASAAAPQAEAAASAPLETAAAPEPPASATGFEWPPSTRLSYVLTGNYHGPVDGHAQVEWLRTEQHYQVRMDVHIGPPFAAIMSRRVSSDGELTEHGLQPHRYDEETQIVFRDARRLAIVFDGQQVHLPGGRDVPQPPGVQDTASQFVQLTWLFTTQPALLESGHSIDLPIALPRYVDTWTYDVLARETLYTAFGPVEAVHVKPRREPRPGVELTAELWIAPSLQYLPVRIVIHQDAQTYIDLLITKLPLQAAPIARPR